MSDFPPMNLAPLAQKHSSVAVRPSDQKRINVMVGPNSQGIDLVHSESGALLGAFEDLIRVGWTLIDKEWEF